MKSTSIASPCERGESINPVRIAGDRGTPDRCAADSTGCGSRRDGLGGHSGGARGGRVHRESL